MMRLKWCAHHGLFCHCKYICKKKTDEKFRSNNSIENRHYGQLIYYVFENTFTFSVKTKRQISTNYLTNEKKNQQRKSTLSSECIKMMNASKNKNRDVKVRIRRRVNNYQKKTCLKDRRKRNSNTEHLFVLNIWYFLAFPVFITPSLFTNSMAISSEYSLKRIFRCAIQNNKKNAMFAFGMRWNVRNDVMSRPVNSSKFV